MTQITKIRKKIGGVITADLTKVCKKGFYKQFYVHKFKFFERQNQNSLGKKKKR